MTRRPFANRRSWLWLLTVAVAASGCPACPSNSSLTPAFYTEIVVPPSNLGPGAVLHNGGTGALTIAILGDGFTADNASMQAYRDAADSLSTSLLDLYPFSALQDAITIFRVDVQSNEAGIDVPETCNGESYNPSPTFAFSRSAKNPDNILETSWCAQAAVSGRPVKYFLSSSSFMVQWFANSTALTPDIIVVLVNDWMFGATAWQDGVIYVSIGQNLTGDVHPTSGSLLQPSVPGAFPDVAIHEIGHVAPFLLLDEYSKNRPPPELDAATAAVIDASPNLTTTMTPLKWAALADVTVPPATDCTVEQPQAGAVKGGYWFSDGVFHAACECRMNNTYSAPFCVVCRQRIMAELAPHLSIYDMASRLGARSWMLLDSLRQTSPNAGRYQVNYAITGGPEPVPSRWPTEGSGMLLQPKQSLIVGQLTGPMLLSPNAASEFTYQLMRRTVSGSIVGPETVEGEDRVALTWPSASARIMVVRKPTYRMTIGLIRDR